MIQLCAIKVAPRKWVITTTDMRDKYVIALPPISIPKYLVEQAKIQNWLKDVMMAKKIWDA